MFKADDIPEDGVRVLKGLVMVHGGGRNDHKTYAEITLSALEGEYGDDVAATVSRLIVTATKNALRRIAGGKSEPPAKEQPAT